MIVYSSPTITPTDLLNGTNADGTHFNITNRYNSNTDFLIDKGEKFEVRVDVGTLDSVGPNEEFQVEIKPPQGATYTVSRKAPPGIDAVMTLD